MNKLFLLLLLLCAVFTGCANQMVHISGKTGVKKDLVTLRGYMRKPEGKGPFPAVILMHGCYGLGASNLPALENHARYLISNGFVALILDSFGPRGKSGGVVCYSGQETAMAVSYRVYDAFSSMEFLREMPFVDPDNIFLVGQSNGGSAALRAAGEVPWGFSAKNKFRAVVAYYPGCMALPYSLISPLLIFCAEQDDWAPSIVCEARKIFTSGEEIEVVIYPKTHHGFDLPVQMHYYAGYTIEGNYEATVDSRKKMVEFFKMHIK